MRWLQAPVGVWDRCGERAAMERRSCYVRSVRGAGELQPGKAPANGGSGKAGGVIGGGAE